MTTVKAYAAPDASAPLVPFSIERRELGPHDISIEILYCGVCHTDIHFVRNDLGISLYPLVPGHEIVGRVNEIGDQVKKFKKGDLAGVGCLVDSCRDCKNCNKGWEQYCLNGLVSTYSNYERDGKTITQGGYSSHIVVEERFVLKISENLPLEKVAPLLCAGITTYSPIKYWNIGKGHKVGIIGLGGLGHMALKFAVSFGSEVTVLSTSPSKADDAMRLGAHQFIYSEDENQLKKAEGYFDFIIDTISSDHDYEKYLYLLTTNSTLIFLGASTQPMKLPPIHMLFTRKSVAGSIIGGLQETQEMLDYCAAHQISSDVEVIKMHEINEAYERLLKGDVRYRFVIDMATL